MKISLIFCLLAVIILVGCIIVLFSIYVKLKRAYDSLKESYQNLEKLNSELRAGRHDYLNHLQVVYGLMELEEYEELHRYLAPVFKDMMKTGKALKTSKPAINALLKAKMDEAESRGIDFYVEVKTDLRALPVEDWELCKVFSNLIDNAMTALSEVGAGDEEPALREAGPERMGLAAGESAEVSEAGREKYIRVELTEDREQYLFSVSNNGPRIPEQLQEEIFRQGFSTKKEEGHGMGLFIVMNVIRTYKGSLDLTSEEETTFTFRFSKEERR